MFFVESPAYRFSNALRILLSFEKEEFLALGIVTPGPHGDGLWATYQADPIRFVCKLDEGRLNALWALIEARQ